MPTYASISAADFAQMQASTLAEKPFQDLVIAAAEKRGWLVYHTHDSRRSQPGFPDLVLVHAGQQRILYRELKTQKGTLRPAQKTWINDLTNAGADVRVWRPIHWFDGHTILRELDPPAPDLTAWAAEAGITLTPAQLEYALDAFATDHPVITGIHPDDRNARRRIIQHFASIHPTEGAPR